MRLKERGECKVRLSENGVCRCYGWRKRNGAGLNLEGENWGTAGAGAASVGVQGKGRDRGGGGAGMMMTPNSLGTDRRGTVVLCHVHKMPRTRELSIRSSFLVPLHLTSESVIDLSQTVQSTMVRPGYDYHIHIRVLSQTHGVAWSGRNLEGTQTYGT